MTNILGYKIYSDTREKLLNFIFKRDKKLHIVSGNPEVLYTGLHNQILFNNFTRDYSVIIPDGAGVVIASKVLNCAVAEKIAGIELMTEILAQCEKENKSVYLLGTQDEILQECIDNINKKFPKLHIIGSHNGYFDLDSCEDIIEDINLKNPFALFVAMGCPRQEIFITKYMDNLNCTIFMGVGGSFDVFAGRVNRAPKWMISINLEWLYRVSKEPWRIKRLGSIPKFLVKAALYRDSKGKP
jgi:N-acetylglucosaminyldiphosphoundecaprenol N-acetyl-beta-D-mannosaminyltransferase